jgi:pre-mRNA-splicing factor CWC22
LIVSFHIFDSLLFFPVVESKKGIEDRTYSEANLVNLRRVIYLTIMNALNYEEAVHKLLKIGIQEGQEVRVLFFGLYCVD